MVVIGKYLNYQYIKLNTFNKVILPCQPCLEPPTLTLKHDFVQPYKHGTCCPQALGIRISFILSTVATLLPFCNLLCHKVITATTTCHYWS